MDRIAKNPKQQQEKEMPSAHNITSKGIQTPKIKKPAQPMLMGGERKA
jgi:hypothetical protein